MKKRRVSIAAHEFALPCPRTGSIEAYSGYAPPPTSGAEAHASAQARRKSRQPGYEAERKVTASFFSGPYEFAVSGRIDGLYREGRTYIVEEIKTAFDAEKLKRKLESDRWHPYALQVMTYAYALENELAAAGDDAPVVPRLLCVSSRTFEETFMEVDYVRADYEAWAERRAVEMVVEQKAKEARKRRRRAAAETLAFPFARPRQGQSELIAEIERAVESEERLMIQAPTGLGKTAGVIFPLLRDALSRAQQLIYVTPKNSQHDLALDAVRRLQAQGSKVKSIALTAKAKICFKDEPICDPERCEFARDHYKKMAEGNVLALAAKKKNLGKASLQKLALEHEVCPFELSLDAMAGADVVIGDYNYALAPRNLVGRWAEPSAPREKRPNLAIDEAHCLPDRALDWFSPEISTRWLEGLRARFRGLRAPFAYEGEALLGRAISMLDELKPWKSPNESARLDVDPAPFLEIDSAIGDFLGRYLASDAVIAAGDPALALRSAWGSIASALQLSAESAIAGDGRFATIYRPDGAGTVKVVCCDASDALKPMYDEFANVVAFSATLKPFAYYGSLTGLAGPKARTAEFRSPFPESNRKVLVIPQVSTKWSRREANYGKIADAIARITAVRPGHYFAFFPSFDFLDRVADRLKAPDGFEILRQTRDGKAAQVHVMLERLREPGRPAIALGVQGGSFAEGVDYPGEMLIGAIVVGPALPSFGIEREIMREHFEKQTGAGFDYAYAFPAMAKSVQAAGRAIRTETDRGIVVLMDSRFLERSFAQAMPSDWFKSEAQELVSDRILADVQEFWRGEAT